MPYVTKVFIHSFLIGLMVTSSLQARDTLEQTDIPTITVEFEVLADEVVVLSPIRVRTAPTTNSEVLGSAQPGDRFERRPLETVEADGVEWAPIRYDEQDAWIGLRYIAGQMLVESPVQYETRDVPEDVISTLLENLPENASGYKIEGNTLYALSQASVIGRAKFNIGANNEVVGVWEAEFTLLEPNSVEVFDSHIAQDFGDGRLRVASHIQTLFLGDIIVATPEATLYRWDNLPYPAQLDGVRPGAERRLVNALREAWIQLLIENDGSMNPKMSREEAERILDSHEPLVLNLRLITNYHMLDAVREDSGLYARLTRPLSQLLVQYPQAVQQVQVDVRQGINILYHPQVRTQEMRNGRLEWMIPITHGEFEYGIDVSLAYGLRVDQNEQLSLDLFLNPLGAIYEDRDATERTLNSPTGHLGSGLGAIPHYANANPTLIATSQRIYPPYVMQIFGELVPGVETLDDLRGVSNSLDIENPVVLYSTAES